MAYASKGRSGATRSMRLALCSRESLQRSSGSATSGSVPSVLTMRRPEDDFQLSLRIFIADANRPRRSRSGISDLGVEQAGGFVTAQDLWKSASRAEILFEIV